MPVCPKCGKNNVPDAKFCIGCGMPMAVLNQPDGLGVSPLRAGSSGQHPTETSAQTAGGNPGFNFPGGEGQSQGSVDSGRQGSSGTYQQNGSGAYRQGSSGTYRPSAAYRQTPPVRRKKSSSMLPLIIVLVVLVIGLLAALAFLLLRDDTDPEPAATPTTTESAASYTAAPAATQADPAVAVGELDTYYVTGTDVSLALFAESGSRGDILAQLSNGDRVGLASTDSGSDWYVYSYDDGCYGYVKKQYLTDSQQAVTEPEDYYVDTPDYLVLRAEPSVTAQELTRLDNREKVTVLAKPTGEFWYVYVAQNEQYGYVSSLYLSHTMPDDRLIGAGAAPSSYLEKYYVYVDKGYLALRSEMAFDTANEIGKMKAGETVYVLDKSTGTYWYVYSPMLGKYGYTNSGYLYSTMPWAYTVTYTVKVHSGYLALRSSCSNSDSNIIGKLYTGETVIFVDSGSNGYWYVYSDKLDMTGYVNKDYLVRN